MVRPPSSKISARYAVYGQRAKYQPMDLMKPLSAHDTFGAAKLAAQRYRSLTGLPAAVQYEEKFVSGWWCVDANVFVS